MKTSLNLRLVLTILFIFTFSVVGCKKSKPKATHFSTPASPPKENPATRTSTTPANSQATQTPETPSTTPSSAGHAGQVAAMGANNGPATIPQNRYIPGAFNPIEGQNVGISESSKTINSQNTDHPPGSPNARVPHSSTSNQPTATNQSSTTERSHTRKKSQFGNPKTPAKSHILLIIDPKLANSENEASTLNSIQSYLSQIEGSFRLALLSATVDEPEHRRAGQLIPIHSSSKSTSLFSEDFDNPAEDMGESLRQMLSLISLDSYVSEGAHAGLYSLDRALDKNGEALLMENMLTADSRLIVIILSDKSRVDLCESQVAQTMIPLEKRSTRNVTELWLSQKDICSGVSLPIVTQRLSELRGGHPHEMYKSLNIR